MLSRRPNSPQDRIPHNDPIRCTADAPTGSSIFSFTKAICPNVVTNAPTAPIITADHVVVTAHIPENTNNHYSLTYV